MTLYRGTQEICPIITVGIQPSGTYDISANGSYNITNYANANVSVSLGALYCWKTGSLTRAYTSTSQPEVGNTVIVFDEQSSTTYSITTVAQDFSSIAFNSITATRETIGDVSF